MQPTHLPPLNPTRARLPVAGLRGRDHRPYLPDERLIAAANAAITLGSPLLLTGEPGCGKTDFAHAVAHYLDLDPGRPPQGLQECHVRSDTRARDLLYHYDALRRFGDAQHGDSAARQAAQDPRRYIDLQPLGLALVAPIQQVVLIDEIDKAPRDLPNDLLHELERAEFEIPEIPSTASAEPVFTQIPAWGPQQRPIERLMRSARASSARRPIVVITSNVERQLPDAFLRRCVFYHIPFPDRDHLDRILRQRAHDEVQHGAGPTSLARAEPYLEQAVTLFMALREQPLHKRPSTAELLAWLEVLGGSYAPESTKQRLSTLARDLTQDRHQLKNHRWHDLPALSCLIKLREDLAALA